MSLDEGEGTSEKVGLHNEEEFTSGVLAGAYDNSKTSSSNDDETKATIQVSTSEHSATGEHSATDNVANKHVAVQDDSRDNVKRELTPTQIPQDNLPFSHHDQHHSQQQQQQQKIALKPLAPKQLLPKILPAPLAKNGSKNGGVNTSKQWVLPPRPRPGRRSDSLKEVPKETGSGKKQAASPLPSNSAMAAVSLPLEQRDTTIEQAHMSPSSAQSVQIKKQQKMKKTTTTASKAKKVKEVDTTENFDLKLQLQNATEENENLRKIIEKLNREIDLLKLVKLERKQKLAQLTSANSSATSSATQVIPQEMPALATSVTQQPQKQQQQQQQQKSLLTSIKKENSSASATAVHRRRVSDLVSTIDPVKINYNLKSKRLKRFNSEADYTSDIGLNGNSLDDAGFYNADSLLSQDLFTAESESKVLSMDDDMFFHSTDPKKQEALRSFSLDKYNKSASEAKQREQPSVMIPQVVAAQSDTCAFCFHSPCVCYESAGDLFQTHDSFIPNFERHSLGQKSSSVVVKKEQKQQETLPGVSTVAQTKSKSKLSRTTDIIGNLGKNFIKNEMDVDMSFFVKPEDQDADDFMMM